MKKLNGFRKMLAGILAAGMVLQCLPALGDYNSGTYDYLNVFEELGENSDAEEISSLSAVVNEIDEDTSIAYGSFTVYDGIVYQYNDEEKWIETDMKPEELSEFNPQVVYICPIDTNVTVQDEDGFTKIYPNEQNGPNDCVEVDVADVIIKTDIEDDSSDAVSATGISAGTYAYGDPFNENVTMAKLDLVHDKHEYDVSISVASNNSDASATGTAVVAEGSYYGEATTEVTVNEIYVSSKAEDNATATGVTAKATSRENGLAEVNFAVDPVGDSYGEINVKAIAGDKDSDKAKAVGIHAETVYSGSDISPMEAVKTTVDVEGFVTVEASGYSADAVGVEEISVGSVTDSNPPDDFRPYTSVDIIGPLQVDSFSLGNVTGISASSDNTGLTDMSATQIFVNRNYNGDDQNPTVSNATGIIALADDYGSNQVRVGYVDVAVNTSETEKDSNAAGLVTEAKNNGENRLNITDLYVENYSDKGKTTGAKISAAAEGKNYIGISDTFLVYSDEEAVGVSSVIENNGENEISVGNVSVNGSKATGIEALSYDPDTTKESGKASIEADIITIGVDDESKNVVDAGTGVYVKSNGETSVITGGISVFSKTDGSGIKMGSGTGNTDISVNGGISVEVGNAGTDTDSIYSIDLRDSAGKTNIEVTGNVSAAGDKTAGTDSTAVGYGLGIANLDKEINVMVDGVLSGNAAAVQVDSDKITSADDLFLTVWKAEENEDKAIVVDKGGNADFAASIEKSIGYIVKWAGNWLSLDTVSTDKGSIYNVHLNGQTKYKTANEDEEVTVAFELGEEDVFEGIYYNVDGGATDSEKQLMTVNNGLTAVENAVNTFKLQMQRGGGMLLGLKKHTHDYTEFVEYVNVPTCVSGGSAIYKCAYCDATKELAVGIDSSNHLLADGDAREVTCTEDGWEAYKYCTREGCNYSTKSIINAGHVFSVDVPAKEANCTEDGYTAHKECSRCHEKNGDYQEIKSLGHDFSVDVSAKTATCTENGYTAHKECGRCHEKNGDYQEIPAGHDFSVIVVAKAATCTENGYTAHKECSRCHEKNGDYQEIPAGHDFSVIVSAKAATCTETGLDSYKCKYCDATITETLAINPDNHSLTDGAAKAVTCTEDGWDAYQYCTRDGCGYSTKTLIEATGHDFSIDVPAKAATCEEDGYTAHKKCSRCGEKDGYQEIKATGHDFSIDVPAKAATCEEDGYTAHKECSRCHEKSGDYQEIKALGHDFSVDVPAKKATCTEDGYTAHKKCNRCGEKDGYQEIEASGHDFEDKLTAGEETHWYACKNCDAKKGEEAHIPSSPVKEKEQAAQVGAAGSYEEVVYCTACGAEISRKTVETDPLPEPKPEQEEESDQTPEAENPSEEPQDSDDTGAISIYTRDDLENVAMPKDVSGDDDDVIIEKLAGCPDNIKGTAKQELASLKRNSYTVDSGFGGWSKSGKTASCTIKLSEQDVPDGSQIFVNGEAVTAKLKDGYYYFPVTLPAVVYVVHK